MQCSKTGCEAPAICYPVLIVRPWEGAACAETAINLPLCSQHGKEVTLDELVTDASWDALCFQFNAQGFQPPDRKLTELRLAKFD